MAKHLWLLWTGRIGGLLVTLFFAAFIVGEGWTNIKQGNSSELLPALMLMAVPFFGYFLAWARPLAGGWLLIAGALLLTGFFWYSGDYAMIGAYAAPALLVGLCFLAANDKEMI
jgi:hypothetical protein